MDAQTHSNGNHEAFPGACGTDRHRCIELAPARAEVAHRALAARHRRDRHRAAAFRQRQWLALAQLVTRVPPLDAARPPLGPRCMGEHGYPAAGRSAVDPMRHQLKSAGKRRRWKAQRRGIFFERSSTETIRTRKRCLLAYAFSASCFVRVRQNLKPSTFGARRPESMRCAAPRVTRVSRPLLSGRRYRKGETPPR